MAALSWPTTPPSTSKQDYLALLDRCLLDRQLSFQEAEAL